VKRGGEQLVIGTLAPARTCIARNAGSRRPRPPLPPRSFNPFLAPSVPLRLLPPSPRCQVKIERLGQFNLKGIQQAPQYRKKLNGFYLGLVDCLQRRLDNASVETGKLQQTYEIFDLKGLGE
jgi:hypothetical protein